MKKQWCSPEVMRNGGLMALRIAVAVVFINHGWMKLNDMNAVVKMLTGMGFFAPVFWAWLLSIVEFVGGIMVLIGFFPRVAAKLLAIDMIVALVFVHTKMPFQIAELAIAMLGASLAILGVGAGKWVVYKKDCACGMCGTVK